MINSTVKIEGDIIYWDNMLKNVFVDVQEIAKSVNQETPSYEKVLDKKDNVLENIHNEKCNEIIKSCDDYIDNNSEDSHKIYIKLCESYKETYKRIKNYCIELENLLKNNKKTKSNNDLIFKKVLDIQELCKSSQKFSDELSKMKNIVDEPRINIKI